MSAREEISVDSASTAPSIKKLAILAGGGDLPAALLEACQAQGIECVVVGFEGFTDQVEPQLWTRIGRSGKTLRFLKQQEAFDLVLIGALKRPGLFELWPDWTTLKFFVKTWRRAKGDNGLLTAARAEFESMGFRLHGVHKFMPQLLMKSGLLGDVTPENAHYTDIQIGVEASQELGLRDLGQAVIVKDGRVLGQEDKHGTSALIRKYGEEGAILVKTCKPQQDQDMDLPAIGPETVKLCAEQKMAGIAGHAGHGLMINAPEVQAQANEKGLFVVGVTIDG